MANNNEWITIPFDSSLSKNKAKTVAGGRRPRIVLTSEYRKALEFAIKQFRKPLSMTKWDQNRKVWISAIIHKPNNRSDAVNFIDAICDAVKQCIPIDDRWYSLKEWDWDIDKKDPTISIKVWQE